jgi:Holliday junction resolvase RusA-like endonuclease
VSQRSVRFDVVGIAQPKGSTRAFLPKGSTRPIVTSDNPKIKGWQQLVAEQAQTVAAGGLFLGAVALAIDFYLPRPKTLPRRVVEHCKKPDLDKLVRSVNDALTGILYGDDAQVVAIRASKRYALGIDAPHAIITLEAFTPGPDDVASPAPMFTEITT